MREVPGSTPGQAQEIFLDQELLSCGLRRFTHGGFFFEAQNFAFVATFDMLIDRLYMPVNR